jgi:hypothetical protein
MHCLHPLVVVINNRLEGLWNVDSIISDLTNNPENSGISWEDVYNADFDLESTFVDKKRVKA